MATKQVKHYQPHLASGHQNHPLEQGFVLVATLFAVAIIALGAAYFASRVDVLRTSAFETQRWAEAERESFSLRETILHAAAIYLRSEGGLETPDGILATDGRQYHLSETLTLQVQDERGLIGINLIEDRLLVRFFTSLGIPLEMHARMLDGLRDYIDDDDLKHLNGAERDDYLAANKPPPPNDFLRSREELASIMGWERIFSLLDNADASNEPALNGVRTRFLALFSTARFAGLNINSAPAAVLAATPGIDPARVSALIDQRRVKPFLNLAQLAPFSNDRLDDEIIGLVGANAWRLTIAKEGLPFLLECQLAITPGDSERPTRVKECLRRSPDAMATGLPNEFSLALRALAGNLNAPATQKESAITALPINKGTNFAERNENRETIGVNESSAPRWLVEVIGPVRVEFTRNRQSR